MQEIYVEILLFSEPMRANYRKKLKFCAFIGISNS